MLLLHGCGTLIAPEFQKTHSSSTEVTEVESGGWQASVALYTGTSVRLLKRRIIKFSPWSAGRYRRDNGRLVAMVRCLGSVWGDGGLCPEITDIALQSSQCPDVCLEGPDR